MSNDPGNHGPYYPPPAPQPSQPKWAWWVVGIAIPVIGIVVTIAASQGGDSNDKSSNTANPPAVQSPQASAPSGSGASGASGQSGATGSSAPGPAAKSPRILFGPGPVSAGPSSGYVDFDTDPPLVTQSNKAADVVFGYMFARPELVTVGSGMTLAPLPAGDTAPTPEECADAIDKRGTYQGGDLTKDSRFCIQTNEGRTAYLRFLAPPAGNVPVRLEVTVWDLP
ncbi:hypothetical protein [Streptomyces sp. SID3343]|uniref:hypothetical protein n=1 Tax=Streptomyces sp. SID3343 TaxID=2690260 RepID=UPI00136C6429|nr:hypothetical protein [Streptomyces sp. SID3343]MYV99900.1 hypothetical protein [Streptomyces sp. SID3343]